MWLRCARKEDLKTPAEELGLVVEENFKVIQLTELISKPDNYDQPLVKDMLQVITVEHIDKEAAALLEAENLRKVQVLAAEKENVEKQQKYELEKFPTTARMSALLECHPHGCPVIN
ncbi:hypothetical protein NPIL_358561 [Nephila pilipes]|uniref:Uncharacterized protein n=1 Tax=Nephila pilipes TaxID=299642 RepID=A0A8X6PQB6_NEPPI|nr:hypothetical protein NPIL_139921 [Nephila pilipes]GFU07511.1 hypothetical protein NPIL_358561 [Nephila pilipes]